MNFFLTLAYLFFIGSVSGWVLELFFRKWFSSSNPEHKWINPGFCTGPYLPIYGFGLCALYLLALLGRETGLDGSIQGRALLFLGMAVSMTLIEYLGGLMLLKGAKIRLWDYSNCRGNIQGLICPLFSFFWVLLGTGYYSIFLRSSSATTAKSSPGAPSAISLSALESSLKSPVPMNYSLAHSPPSIFYGFLLAAFVLRPC